MEAVLDGAGLAQDHEQHLLGEEIPRHKLVEMLSQAREKLSKALRLGWM